MTAPDLDLDRYLARIAYAGPLEPGLEALSGVHLAHLAAIPFENLDVRLGRPVGLDLTSLQEKLVRRRRGGYCFEQNSLFAAVLGRLGFTVATLEARVRPPGATAPLPRTHMMLSVEVAGRSWLADVGFGGDGPLLPVPIDGQISAQPDGEVRVVAEANQVRALQRRSADGWTDLYAFGPTPALPIDFAVAHHYTSTHPRSPFVTGLTVQRSTREARTVLRGRAYLERRGAVVTERELENDEVPELLRTAFGLEVSDQEVRAALA